MIPRTTKIKKEEDELRLNEDIFRLTKMEQFATFTKGTLILYTS
jgi:hypothetical protein